MTIRERVLAGVWLLVAAATVETFLVWNVATTEGSVSPAALAVAVGMPLVALLAALGILLSVRRSLVAPLGELTTNVWRVASGEYPQITPSIARDEIAALTNALERMVTAIAQREDDLRREALEARGLAEHYAHASAEIENAAGALHATIDTLPVGLVIVEKGSEEIRFQNEAASSLLGVPRGRGATLADWEQIRFIDAQAEPVETEDWFVRRALRGERVEAEALEVHAPGGAVASVLVAAVPLYGDESEVRGAVVSIQNISRIRELEGLKDEFVSIIGQELREPLHAVRGALTLVLGRENGALGAESRQVLDVALAGSERLLRTIDHVLELSQIEAGRLVLTRRPCRVEEIVRDAIDGVEPQAAALHVEIQPDIAEGLPFVLADTDRAVRALGHLLSNAVTVAPEGTAVTIKVFQGERGVSVAVSDRGAGISPEDRALLFQRVRKQSGVVRRKGGAGLGLAIAKAIVDGHGGSIGVESAPGEGSTFTMVLPQAARRASDLAPARPEAQGPGEPGT